MNANPNIVAPNTTIEDDSIGQIASRVVARIRAKGLGIQGVYVDDWSNTLRADAPKVRQWSVDVVLDGASDPDAQTVVGSVEIIETLNVHSYGVRGIAAANATINHHRRHFSIGYSGNVAELQALLGVVAE